MDESVIGDRHQYAVLAYSRTEDGAVRVFLVTSRDSGRWTIPKGNPMPGKKPHRAAAIEAREEAGLAGRVGKRPLGSYVFWKRRADHFELATVTVFPLAVERRLDVWKECDQRQVRAFAPADAAELVTESGLSQLIITLEQKLSSQRAMPVKTGGGKPRSDHA